MNSDFKELQAAFSQIGIAVDESIQEAIRDTAKEGTKKLKKRSRELFGNGPYAKGWTYKIDSSGGKAVIYNKKYQFTHLLEKGHDIVHNGRKVGEAKAYPHIKPVEEFCIEEIEKEIVDDLNKKLEGI